MKMNMNAILIFFAASSAHAISTFNPDPVYVLQNKNDQAKLERKCDDAVRILQFKGLTNSQDVISRLSMIEKEDDLNTEISKLALSDRHQSRLRKCLKSLRDFRFFLEKKRNTAEPVR